MARRDVAILEAALELFYAQGFHAVGVDDIGARAGVSGPAIYRHFKGKDEILATLFDQAVDEMNVRLGPVRDDPDEELELLVSAQADFATTNRPLLSIYAREDRSLAPDSRRRIRRRQRQYVQRWIDALQHAHPGCAERRYEVAAHAILGMLLSVAQWPDSVVRTECLGDQLRALALATADALGTESEAMDARR